MLRQRENAAGLPGPPIDVSTNGLEALGFEEAQIGRLLRAVDRVESSERQRAARSVRAALASITAGLEATVRSAVIPAAGGHHRILAWHITHRLLLRSIREAIESGIREITLVLAPGTWDCVFAPLRAALDLADVPAVTLHYCEQPMPLGLGDAILHAEAFVAGSPFAVLLPDDVLGACSGRAVAPKELSRMMETLTNVGTANIVAVTPVPRSRMPLYGIATLDVKQVAPGVSSILQLQEKPARAREIAQLTHAYGIVGRYLLQPAIFRALRELREGRGDPLQLTDALELLRAESYGTYAFELKATRKDIGGALAQAADLIRDSDASPFFVS